MPAIPLYRSSTPGLVTKHDPARLQGDAETGARPMVRAINVVVDIDGRTGRRTGRGSAVESGRFHSAWSNPAGDAFAVKDDSLCQLSSSGSDTLRALTPGHRVSYVWAMGRSYWSDGRENGYIEGGANHTWGTERAAWDRMADHHKLDKKRVELSSPPAGHLLEYNDGRMLVAAGPWIHISEPGFPGLFLINGFRIRVNGPVTLLAAVQDGLWVSDGMSIHWFGGPVHEMSQNRVVDYGAIEGAMVKIDGQLLGLEMSGNVVVFVTSKGVCVGAPGGYFTNLTRATLETEKDPKLFEARYGTGAVIGDQIIFSLEP